MSVVETKNKRCRLIPWAHYALTLIVLLHGVFYLVYWFSVGDFRSAVDGFVSSAAGLAMPYTLVLMVSTGLFVLWSMVRFVSLRQAVRKLEWAPTLAHRIYAGVGVAFLALFYGSFIFILQENPGQRGILAHLLDLVRLVSDPFLFLLGAVWLRRLIVFLRDKRQDAKYIWPWTVGIVSALVSLVGLWLVPAIFPPAWAYQGDLPAKPALMAHRGASMLAPENTLAAIDLAAEYQAFGFESDIRISLDGIPFLMHDETLVRTTNIAEVFPERVDDPASSFTMAELKSLNAGLWFIQKDPYRTIGSGLVSQSQLSINQGQKIPTLREALEDVRAQGMVILFDMRFPPEDHPFYDEYFEIVFTECKQSGLRGDIWFLLSQDQVGIVQEEAPQMTRVLGAGGMDLPGVQSVLDLNYEILNVDTGIPSREILAYREEGLGVNVYTVDEPWLFSQLWISGVTSVTTNNVHTFSDLDRPFPNLSYGRFILIWGLVGIVLAIWLAGSQPRRASITGNAARWKTPDLTDLPLEEAHKVDTIYKAKKFSSSVESELGEDVAEHGDITNQQESDEKAPLDEDDRGQDSVQIE